MIKIYLGRENQDKEHFLFAEIAKTLAAIRTLDEDRKVFLLVPDQYTLQAERNALKYLNEPGLIDLEVLSENRLADRILSQQGGRTRVHIDRLGRHMLLSRIISQSAPELRAYGGLAREQSFIDRVNNLLSEFKQYGATPDMVAEAAAVLPEDSILRQKLTDLQLLFSRYQQAIQDKYTDTEDFVDLFLSRLVQSDWVRRSDFWISGFDYLSPKTRRLIAQLDRCARSVQLILTGDPGQPDSELFQLSWQTIRKVRADAGEEVPVIPIIGFERAVAEEIRHIERELYEIPGKPFSDGTTSSSGGATSSSDSAAFSSDSVTPSPGGTASSSDCLTFCRAANFYNEAETAAAYIVELVRDRGYRYRDVAVICNDLDQRGRVLRRVFTEYEIPFFMDQKRQPRHNPAVVYLFALLDILNKKWRGSDIFQLLKTALTPFERAQIDRLENYALRYRIHGNAWRQSFRYGSSFFPEEELQEIEQTRQELADYLEPIASSYKTAETVADKIAALRVFLEEQSRLPEQLEQAAARLEIEGEQEAAQELLQIWSLLSGIFEQTAELAGDQVMSGSDFSAMLQAGVDALEIGLIPGTSDQAVIGTMQRSRLGPVKAVIVTGANDGVLPAETVADELLSRDERALLYDRQIEICKDDKAAGLEEQLAIYRNLSSPEKRLFISYTAADAEGRELRPSHIFHKLTALFPRQTIEGDLFNRNDPFVRIQRQAASLRYLAEKLRDQPPGEDQPPGANQPPGEDQLLRSLLSWHQEKNLSGIELVNRGISFTNQPVRLDKRLAKRLFSYSDDLGLVVSPSRLELFSRCPFAHWLRYGLAPVERRVFELSSRESGDIYHECLRRLAETLTDPALTITDQASPWMTISREACSQLVNQIMDEIAPDYAEGISLAGKEEQYRSRRMKAIVDTAAWELIRHVRRGTIERLYLEQTFSRFERRGEDGAAMTPAAFPPVTIPVAGGEILIEGKIDRLDVLPGNYIKIIDYKSGADSFDQKETRSGWRLQLMLYLKAALNGLAGQAGPDGEAPKPAGVFYFRLAEPRIDLSFAGEEEEAELVENALQRKFLLDGVVVNDAAVIESIAGAFTGSSDVLRLRRNQDGAFSAQSKCLISEEEFAELQQAVDQLVGRLCQDLADGKIDIRPKYIGQRKACDYCPYKSICNFELSFDGNEYDVVI
jgi:ATP-dependent helicase/nuclease subunit B